MKNGIEKLGIAISAAIGIVALVAFVSFISGTIVWLIWPYAIPVAFPGLVAKGFINETDKQIAIAAGGNVL